MIDALVGAQVEETDDLDFKSKLPPTSNLNTGRLPERRRRFLETRRRLLAIQPVQDGEVLLASLRLRARTEAIHAH
jgi:hypothetical protein